jgi:hypothetical protein
MRFFQICFFKNSKEAFNSSAKHFAEKLEVARLEISRWLFCFRNVSPAPLICDRPMMSWARYGPSNHNRMTPGCPRHAPAVQACHRRVLHQSSLEIISNIVIPSTREYG